MPSAIIERDQDYERLVEFAPVGIACLDGEGRYTYVNGAFERAMGISRNRLIGRTVRETDIENADRIDALVRDTITSGGEGRDELRIRGRSYRYRLVAHAGAGGAVESLVLYADDITEHARDLERIVRSNAQLRELSNGVIHSLVRLVEMRDPYTAGHQRHVSQLAFAISGEMGFSSERAEGVRIAGLMHDVGKLVVPVEILNKMGRLSAMETQIIRIHPTAGYDILKDMNVPWPIARIAYQHQERFDGSGYPRGLRSEEICLEARITSVADVVEAITFHRPYRQRLGLGVALDQIKRGKGKLYDPAVADAAVQLFAEDRFRFDEGIAARGMPSD